MDVFLKKLHDLNIQLSDAATPIANYKPTQQSAKQIFVSGQLPLQEGKLYATGRVGAEVTPSEAQKAARLCALNILSHLYKTLGDFTKIKQIVKLTVFVAVDNTSINIPLIANGASDLFADVFGEKGKHARSAVGVYALPLNAPVEIEAIIEIE